MWTRKTDQNAQTDLSLCWAQCQKLHFLMLRLIIMWLDLQLLFALGINQGPVVQSVISLTSSLRVISLTVLADLIYNILIFFAEKM